MISPKTLLGAVNLYPRKQLGQNFLSDASTAEMIITRTGISADDVILEIGSGLGALTIPAARIAHRIYAVDKDAGLINLLKTQLAANQLSNVVLMEQDILKVDINTLAENAGRKLLILGNLPYNISSQILIKLILSRNAVDRAILMFQKELAQRIIAKVGTKDYGRIGVMLRYCADIKPIAEVKASQFFPKPKIDSQVIEVRFKRVLDYPAPDEKFLFQVIKAAFGQRRKTLKNALIGSELHLDAARAAESLEHSGIDPCRRAETLSVEEFVRLSNSLI